MTRSETGVRQQWSVELQDWQKNISTQPGSRGDLQSCCDVCYNCHICMSIKGGGGPLQANGEASQRGKTAATSSDRTAPCAKLVQFQFTNSPAKYGSIQNNRQPWLRDQQ
jgi:hypothetical protein